MSHHLPRGFGFLLAIAFLTIAGCGHPPAKEPHRALYLELNEINRDGFQKPLFVPEPSTQQAPFRLEGGKIVVNPEAQDPHLHLDKPGMDLKTEAKIFLVHHAQYVGAGREGAVSDYYVFSHFPARVELPADETGAGALDIGVGDSIGKTFHIRIFPASTIIFSEKGERAVISFAGKETLVTAVMEAPLSKLSRMISVTQQLFGPVPKGEIHPEDTRVMAEDYGTVEFSTELSLKNHGQHEVELAQR